MKWFLALGLAALFCITQANYVNRGNVRYFFGKNKLTWAAAEANCRSRGGSLTSARNIGEWNFIYNAARKRNMKDFWIGINDRKKEGAFVWSDGSRVVFKRWSRGEPNNHGGNEDCGMEWRNGFWNDGTCNDKRTFVCRIAPIAKYRGARYFFSKIARSWDAAAQDCRNRGARLTSVHSLAEWNFLLREGKRRRGLVNFYIGFNDKRKEGKFVWSDNTKVLFTRWDKNEPNNAGGKEDCAEEWKNGLWNDIPCNLKRPYVCEFIPNEQGGNYFIATARSSWGDAQKRCRRLRGNLATIQNQKENRNLNKELRRRGVKQAWIGYNDIRREGFFRWVSGQKSCYSDWCVKEPNNLGNEDCAQIAWGANGCWNDNKCRNKYPYVCEF